jgi:D-alanyl-D-alanine carboxypeptidase/D-alanyl-D-alanine-endopeptidase (penicillin-binding protein 4)
VRKRRAIVAVAAGVAVAGVVTVVATGAWRQLDLGTASAGTDLASPQVPVTSSTPTPAPAPVAAALTPVLEPADISVQIDPDKVAARIEKVGGIDGARISATVLSADSDDPLYQRGAASVLTPASTTKVLSSAAALKQLGPTHRFSTSVVADGGDRIVLVGGGDPYLAGTRDSESDPGQASLEDLAVKTAKQLKQDKITSVELGYDASLFSGPAWNPNWRDVYRSYVTPTTALWADEGQLYGAIGPRQSDPADAAAELFADQLRSAGIKINSVDERSAADDADTIATVESLSLERIVERLLMSSDNDAAEVVARQAAIGAGRTGSIDAALKTIEGTLDEVGAWDEDSRVYDGSGLSRDTKVSSEVLAEVMQLAVSGDEPSLGPLLTGLPVAGVEGSLRYRFDTAGAQAGQGIVHAKTGTLTEVRSLAGYSYTRDGELLIFAVVVNGVANDYTALTWLDRVVAAVAGCGCRA